MKPFGEIFKKMFANASSFFLKPQYRSEQPRRQRASCCLVRSPHDWLIVGICLKKRWNGSWYNESCWLDFHWDRNNYYRMTTIYRWLQNISFWFEASLLELQQNGASHVLGYMRRTSITCLVGRILRQMLKTAFCFCFLFLIRFLVLSLLKIDV